MRLKVLRYGFLVMILLLVVFTTVRAADAISLDIIYVDNTTSLQIDWMLKNPVVDDPGGYDIVWIALIDCQGVVIGFHAHAYFLEDGPVNASRVTIPLRSLKPITGQRVYAELYDTPDDLFYYSIDEIYGILQAYPLRATATLDMGESYPECPPPQEVEPNPDIPPAFDDDRLNVDPGAPIVMYNVDGSFQIYKVSDNSVGTIAVYISAAELVALETPNENTEFARSADNSVVVYKLSSGEIQVNTAPDSERKVFVYILSANALTLISSNSYIA